MKKIYIGLVSLFSLTAFSQVTLNTAPAQDNGSNAFLDASQNNPNYNNNIGRGLVFPTVDLTTFKLNTSVLDGINFPNAYDGMLVYNSATGNTVATGQGLVTAVTPGFYYFKNPNNGGGTSISQGIWTPFGGTLTKEQLAANAWVLGGNSSVSAADAVIGTKNAQNVSFVTANVNRMIIGEQSAQNVGGVNFDFVLDVIGKARFRKGIVTEASTYPDYVFEKYFTGSSKINPNYQFKSLAETEKFVKENNHLPGVSKITEFSKDGQKYLVDAAELSIQNLEKVEELYLHTIEQQKQIDALKAELAEIKAALKK